MYDNKIDTLRNKLQEKTKESNARHEGMIHYFWKVCVRIVQLWCASPSLWNTYRLYPVVFDCVSSKMD